MHNNRVVLFFIETGKLRNVKFNHKNTFLHFVYSNKEKRNKQNKTIVKIHKVLKFQLGGEAANHANFMQSIC